MPFYVIETKGQEAKRLVKADSSQQAIKHCAIGLFTATTVSNVGDVADLLEAGVKVEKAGAQPAAAEPQQPDEGGSEGGGEGAGVGGDPPQTELTPPNEGKTSGRKPAAAATE